MPSTSAAISDKVLLSQMETMHFATKLNSLCREEATTQDFRCNHSLESVTSALKKAALRETKSLIVKLNNCEIQCHLILERTHLLYVPGTWANQCLGRVRGANMAGLAQRRSLIYFLN